jgi:predicted Zn finger-like uncharacterized protein
MTVRCPHCSARYDLPEALMGAAGAQVRCPACKGVFAVTPAGVVREVSKPAPAPRDAGGAPVRAAPPAHAPPSAEPPPNPESVAGALVSEFAARAGEGPREAFRRGRLFSEWGPALMDLYGEYRRRVGAAASGAPLRAALRERWGIDLPEGDPRGLTG